MVKTVIYPGTFDPMTNGHIDLIDRMSNLFDHVVVAVAANARKAPLFSLKERVNLAKSVLQDKTNVDVCGFDNLLIDFAREKKAKMIVRGLRAVADFEYEYQLAGMNRKLAPEIETIFMLPNDDNSFLSATMVKEIATLGGAVNHFVHPLVEKALRDKLGDQ